MRKRGGNEGRRKTFFFRKGRKGYMEEKEKWAGKKMPQTANEKKVRL